MDKQEQELMLIHQTIANLAIIVRDLADRIDQPDSYNAVQDLLETTSLEYKMLAVDDD